MGRLNVDVSSILADTGASLQVDVDVPLERVVAGDTVVAFTEALRVVLTISNTGAGLVAVGSVTARATTECSRCLEPFALTVEGSVENGYLTAGSEAPVDADAEWEVFEGEAVDLFPAIEAALVVEVPFAPIHDEECLGICPTCGCDLNAERCDCQPAAQAARDNPFAALKDLVAQEPGEEP